MSRPRIRCRLVAALALLAAAVGSSAPGRAVPFGKAPEPATYETGLALFDDGKYRPAIVELKRFLERERDHGAARLLVGRALVRVGLGRSAEEQLRRAAAHGADAGRLALALARSYLLQGKFARLLDEIEPGERAPDIEASVAYLRGLAHFGLSQFDEADHGFATALAHDPGHLGSLLGWIRVRLARFRLDDAARLADDVVKLAPKAPDPWYLVGEIARRRGDAAGALAAYGKALAVAPGHLPARIARAAVLIDTARPRQAMADIKAVLAIVPSDPQSALLRALNLARTGNADAAQSVLRRLASTIDRQNKARRDDNPTRMLLAGVINYSRRALDESLHDLRRYLDHAPQHLGARLLISGILAERGDFAGAIADLRPALDSGPGDPDLLGLMGGLLMRAGRHGEAAAVFETALARAPGSASLARHLTLSRLAAGRPVAAHQALGDLLGALDPVRGGAVIALLQLRNREFDAALNTARGIAARRPASPFARNLAGIVRLRQGAGDAARRHFEEARALDPGYTPALHNLASVAKGAGDFETAGKLYRQVLTSAPADAAAMIELSALGERAGDLATAIRWLARAHQMDKGRVAVTLALGDLYLRAGRAREALRLVTSFGQRHGRDKRLLEVAARASIAVGDTAGAIRIFRDVSGAETGDAGVLDRIARVQASLGDTKGAIFTFRTAMALDVRDHRARDGVLELEAPSGGTDRELVYAETLRHRYPSSGIGHVVAGNAWTRAEAYDKAADAYAAAFRIEPSAATALHRFRALRRAGRLDAGLRFLERWIADHPDDRAARRALAFASIRAGRLKRASELHRELLAASPAESPDDAPILNNLAWLSARLGDGQALSFARRAHVLRPFDPAILDTYGMILVESGEPERGLALLRRAQVGDAGDARLHYHAGVALDRLGRPAEARAELEAALRSEPSFAEAGAVRRLLQSLDGS